MVEKKLKIALNVLCVKKMAICSACFSKHNSNREKQVILLMIPNREECHCHTVKNYKHS